MSGITRTPNSSYFTMAGPARTEMLYTLSGPPLKKKINAFNYGRMEILQAVPLLLANQNLPRCNLSFVSPHPPAQE